MATYYGPQAIPDRSPFLLHTASKTAGPEDGAMEALKGVRNLRFLGSLVIYVFPVMIFHLFVLIISFLFTSSTVVTFSLLP
jgi:hypothetical protein